jgi:hypothetical protein
MLILSERPVQRMWRKLLVWLSKSVMPIATPGVMSGVVDHIRPNWIEFDIALAVDQVSFCLDEG